MENSDSKLEKLMYALRDLESPVLSDARKSQMKGHLLAQMKANENVEYLSSDLGIVASMRKMVSELSLPIVEKVAMKERLFSSIVENGMKKHFWYRFFDFNKKLVSTAMLFVLAFGMFSFVAVDTDVVRASTFTKLSDFSGDVQIDRDGEGVEVYEGMELYEDDRIVTGDGEVVIEYFNDSVSRLANDTEIVINRLWTEDENNLKTYVEVYVAEGVIWSKVLELVEKDSSFVIVTDDTETKSSRGAFSVELIDDEVEVEVFNHAVEVSTEEVASQKLVSGYKAIIEIDEVEIKELKESEKEIDWVKDNLEEDSVYVAEVEDRVLAAKMENLDVYFDEDYSFDKTIRESSLLLVTFDDVKKGKIELDIAEKNFLAAEVKLHDPDLTESDKLEYEIVLNDFKEEVENFYEVIGEIEEKEDGEYADELDEYIEEKILLVKKDVSVNLPDSPAYKAKEIIEELELLTVTEEEVYVVKAEQALNKLGDAEELVIQGNIELAKEVIEEYEQEAEVVAVEIVMEDDGVLREVEEVVIGVVDQIITASEVEAGIVPEVTEDELVEEVEVMKENVVKAVEELEEEIVIEEAILDVIGEETTVEEPVIEESEEITTIWTHYGVEIYGDKPLSPLLNAF